MKKNIIFLAVFCLVFSFCLGGCKGAKEEKKKTTPQAAKAEKKTVPLPEINHAPNIVDAKNNS